MASPVDKNVISFSTLYTAQHILKIAGFEDYHSLLNDYKILAGECWCAGGLVPIRDPCDFHSLNCIYHLNPHRCFCMKCQERDGVLESTKCPNESFKSRTCRNHHFNPSPNISNPRFYCNPDQAPADVKDIWVCSKCGEKKRKLESKDISIHELKEEYEIRKKKRATSSSTTKRNR